MEQPGGLRFLNPAAVATPQPGTFGNLARNEIHGPGFKQIDLVVGKQFPVGTLPNALPGAGESAPADDRPDGPGSPCPSARHRRPPESADRPAEFSRN